MAIEGFDYKEQAKLITKSVKKHLPRKISREDKNYITDLISNFTLLAAEALYNDESISINAEQAIFITQIIAEWSFQKSIDLIKSGIEQKYWDPINQKIAFVIFEVAKNGIIRKLPEEQMLELLQYHAIKTYNKSIEDLFSHEFITEDIKNKAIIQDEKLLKVPLETSVDNSADAKKTSEFEETELSNEDEILDEDEIIDEDEVICIENRIKDFISELPSSDEIYNDFGVSVITIEFGTNLINIIDPLENCELIQRLVELRHELVNKYGYVIPIPELKINSDLNRCEYRILIRGNAVASGYLYPDKYMVIADRWDSVNPHIPEDAIIGVDPKWQTQAYWISQTDTNKVKSVTSHSAIDVIIGHLEEISIKFVNEIMTKTDVLKLMGLVRSQDPTLVNDLVPAIISTSDLRKIFVNLIREKVSIKDIIFVFERLCDYARFSKEPDILSERLRVALGRQICLSNVDKDHVLFALTLSPEWEKTLDDSYQRTELGTMFLLNPIQVQDLVESTAMTLMRAHQQIGQQPVILCSPRIRFPLYQLLERHIPTIVVISYSELIPDIKVEAVDTICGENDDNSQSLSTPISEYDDRNQKLSTPITKYELLNREFSIFH